LPEQYQLLIAGAGPAGLSAGIYGARMGLKTVVVSEVLGGQASENSLIENYPGFDRISGMELSEKMRGQAEKWGATLRVPERIVEFALQGEEKVVRTDQETYSGQALIIATGAAHRKLGVPGEEEFRGRGVSYCGTCDGPLFKGRTIAVVGGGNSAAVDTLILKDLAGRLYLIHRRDDLRADQVLKERILRSNVTVLWHTEVKSIEGDRLVRRLRLFNNKTGTESVLEVDGVFIRVGEEPQSGLAKKAGVAVDEMGHILVNQKRETNIPGVYAAGDVTGGVYQIGTAVGDGITAAVNAYLFMTGGWYRRK
jgi:thioredoxin reductase (NADPH)